MRLRWWVWLLILLVGLSGWLLIGFGVLYARHVAALVSGG